MRLYTVFFIVASLLCGWVYGSFRDGLVAYYPLDGSAEDASGYGNHGVVSGARPTTDRDGNANSAYYFDGIDDHIRIGNSASVDIRGSLTLVAWVKEDSGWGQRQIVWRGDNRPAIDPYFLYVAQNDVVSFSIQHKNVNFAYCYSDYPIDTDWHLWVGVYDESTGGMYLYEDAILQDVSEVMKGSDYDGSGMWNMIGAANDGNLENFKGSIDEVMIYNRALTYDEIVHIYSWPSCGDLAHPVPVGDLNEDCRVDFADLAVMAAHWMECTFDCD